MVLAIALADIVQQKYMYIDICICIYIYIERESDVYTIAIAIEPDTSTVTEHVHGNYWAVVKELKLEYHNPENILATIQNLK